MSHRWSTAIALVAVALLSVLATLLATASSDSAVGRARSAVADAFTVPPATASPAPPTADPAVGSLVAVEQARTLAAAVEAGLAAGDRDAAVTAFNALSELLASGRILAGPDYTDVYERAEALRVLLSR